MPSAGHIQPGIVGRGVSVKRPIREGSDSFRNIFVKEPQQNVAIVRPLCISVESLEICLTIHNAARAPVPNSCSLGVIRGSHDNASNPTECIRLAMDIVIEETLVRI